MERLTKRRENGNAYVTDDYCFDTWANSFEGKAIDRLAYYEDTEEQGRAWMPPCAVGERWKDKRDEVFVVDGFHCDKWAGWSILYHYEDGETCSCNEIYFKAHFTREDAENALATDKNVGCKEGGTDHDNNS